MLTLLAVAGATTAAILAHVAVRLGGCVDHAQHWACTASWRFPTATIGTSVATEPPRSVRPG